MPNLRAVIAAALLLAATSALAQETSPPSPGAAEPGLSFRIVDDSADAAAHAGEAQAGFKDQTLWLESEAPITGRMVASARPFFDGPDRRPTVAFQLTPEGAARFAALTKANVGRRIAILVDGRVVAAPRIQTEMADGVGAISGDFSRHDASVLAMQINGAAGPR